MGYDSMVAVNTESGNPMNWAFVGLALSYSFRQYTQRES